MVLRTGIILPFQFRDTKKLLMVGSPEENRDLNLFDLKNAVRTAFGIEDFVFRNKKIDFTIPEEMVLNYLAQRHDLTNFVIEVRLDIDEAYYQQQLLIQQQHIVPGNSYKERALRATRAKLLNNANNHAQICHANAVVNCETSNDDIEICSTNNTSKRNNGNNNNNDSSHSQVPAKKARIYNGVDTLTMVLPKLEKSNNDVGGGGGGGGSSELKYKSNSLLQHHITTTQHTEQQSLQLQQQQQQQQLETSTTTSSSLQQHEIHASQQHYHHSHISPSVTSSFFSTYHSTASLPSPQPPQHQQQSTTQHQQQSTPQQHPLYSPSLCHRRRGERMSKDQKEIYVKYLEDNPCILSQRRNDNSIEPYWIKLAALLNSVTQGAVKTVEEWKQTFDAWRYRVFMYTRFNARLSAEGNQHPKNYKPLTATDQRAYAMWTSHKHSAPGDYDKIDMFGNLDDTQNTFDY